MKVNYRTLEYLKKYGFHSNNWLKLHQMPLRRIAQCKKLHKEHKGKNIMITERRKS